MIADEGLTLVMHSDARLGFNTLLQRGVYLTGRGGLTVRGFLHEVVGYDDVCIEGEVRTIFLNFSPMDGLDETYIKDGDRLALGSAMPGLVGICMGRDNPYKSFQERFGKPEGLRRTSRSVRSCFCEGVQRVGRKNRCGTSWLAASSWIGKF